MNSNFFDGFRDKIYFVTCPLCKGDENIDCEICFNERRRLFYMPGIPLKSATVVWADNIMNRVVYFVDRKGMFSLDLDETAFKSLASLTSELEELSYNFIPGNPGEHKNELVIELNEID